MIIILFLEFDLVLCFLTAVEKWSAFSTELSLISGFLDNSLYVVHIALDFLGNKGV